MYEFESSIESYILNAVERCLMYFVGLLSVNVDNISQIYNVWIKVKDFTVNYHLILVASIIFMIIIKIKTLMNALKSCGYIVGLAIDSYILENNCNVEDCDEDTLLKYCVKYIDDHVKTQQKTNNASYIRCIISLLKYDLLDGVIKKHIKNYKPIDLLNEVK